MATSKEYKEFILEQLDLLDSIRSKQQITIYCDVYKILEL